MQQFVSGLGHALRFRRDIDDVRECLNVALLSRGYESPGFVEALALIPAAQGEDGLRAVRAPAHAAQFQTLRARPELRYRPTISGSRPSRLARGPLSLTYHGHFRSIGRVGSHVLSRV